MIVSVFKHDWASRHPPRATVLGRRTFVVAVLGICAAVACPVAAANARAGTPASAPTRLIVDTDIFLDVDDVGAIAIANALQDRGEVKLLAVLVNTRSRWGAPAVDAIDTYYHHGNIPLGTVKPNTNEQPFTTFPNYYPQYLAQHFPNSIHDGNLAPDATVLYRRVLAAQPDHSVTIASIGLLTNLAHLLDSRPDRSSSLTGYQLVKRKVKLLAVMGGVYPSGFEYNFPATDFEYNFPGDVGSAAHVVNDWPTRQVFDGLEVGATILTGGRLASETPHSNPVRKAYAIYAGAGVNHSSYDLTDVYYSVRGLAGLFRYGGQGGSNYVLPGGFNVYRPTPAKNENYLIKAAPDATIAKALDDLLVQAPTGGRPPRHRKTPPRLVLRHADWLGRTLSLKGRSAMSLSGRLRITFRCARSITPWSAPVHHGRWRTRLHVPARCSESRSGGLTISYAGDRIHTAGVLKRRLSRRLSAPPGNAPQPTPTEGRGEED